MPKTGWLGFRYKGPMMKNMEPNGNAANFYSPVATEHERQSGAKVGLTVSAAKRNVFVHWQYLEHLCQRKLFRYPNLVHEALLFVLDGLQKNEWRRVLAWDGEGDFKAYISVLASRLIIDFKRKKFGQLREPQWLEQKRCAVWKCAYNLIVTEKILRHPSINQLKIRFPYHSPEYIESIVSEVVKYTVKKPSLGLKRRAAEEIERCGTSIDSPNLDEIPSSQDSPESEFNTNAQISSCVMWCLLDPTYSIRHVTDSEVRKFLPLVRRNLKLGAGDYKLLRLHIIEQYSIKKVSEITGLTGDPYKRFERIYADIRRACDMAGIGPG